MRKQVPRVCVLILAIASLGWAAGSFELFKRVSVPGTGGWDYLTVDEAARRVYISHSTQVDVIDADSFGVIGTIPNTPGVHGIALAPEFGRGYISAGKADAVIAFDLATLKARRHHLRAPHQANLRYEWR